MSCLPLETVSALGEQGLLQHLQTFCPVGIVGDDGAVLDFPTAEKLVITTDVLIENVHFSDQTTPPESVGWRAVAANLSDLAAMGADPIGITVGLGIPGSCPVAWVSGVYAGMKRCLDTYRSPLTCGEHLQGIVGGDVCRAPVRTLAITAFGSVDPRHILRRSALQIGDQLVVTGYHGASRAGLALLQQQSPENQSIPRRSVQTQSAQTQSIQTERSATLPPEGSAWIQAHQFPRPRLEVLPVLRSFQAALSRPLAAMDSSDGLGDAVLQLCRASGVGARIWRDRLPIPPGLTAWVGEAQAVTWCLYGGEDFELVLGLPLDCLEAFLMQVPGSRWIGEAIDEPGVVLVNDRLDDPGASREDFPTDEKDPRDDRPPIPLAFASGFQHFEPDTPPH